MVPWNHGCLIRSDGSGWKKEKGIPAVDKSCSAGFIRTLSSRLARQSSLELQIYDCVSVRDQRHQTEEKTGETEHTTRRTGPATTLTCGHQGAVWEQRALRPLCCFNCKKRFWNRLSATKCWFRQHERLTNPQMFNEIQIVSITHTQILFYKKLTSCAPFLLFRQTWV